MKFENSIRELKGIGEKNAALFHKLHIESLEDLLFHFPRDYETYPSCETLQELMQNGRQGAVSEPAFQLCLPVLMFVDCILQK